MNKSPATDAAWQSSGDLVDELSRYVAERASGTLFIRTSDNHWGCFVFDKGAIVSMMCRGVRGTASIRHLRRVSRCTCRFDPDALLGEDAGDLPPTEELLRELGGEATVAQIRRIGVSALDLKHIVKKAAVAIIGPMGELICDEQFARAGMLSGMDDLDRVLRQIGREMEPGEASEFRRQVMAEAGAGGVSGLHPQVSGLPELNRLRSLIQTEAAEYLGPVAPVLCEEYFNQFSAGRSVADVGRIVTALVNDIGDAELGEEFRARVAERLQSAG